jgi:alginate O-acetyltransferase complex protein AlgF
MQVRAVVMYLLVILSVPGTVSADTKSVYGPETPGNSAFVRFVNAVPGKPPIELDLGATRFDALGYAEVSPYRPVTPDIYQLEAAGQEKEVIPRSGVYYTIVCAPKAIVVLEDPPHVDPARAQLFLYNFSPLPKVDLKTADGKTGVIPAVAPATAGMKTVNAAAVSLAVFSGDRRLSLLGDLGLQRGSSFSIFVLGENASPSVFAVKARVVAE